ncbi:MAG: hypothetical protein AVDCRST_MAG01-01-1003, partial [uncultured Rubrobacteraceae bacterium]
WSARGRTHRRATAPASRINLLGVLIDLTNASVIVPAGGATSTG